LYKGLYSTSLFILIACFTLLSSGSFNALLKLKVLEKSLPFY
jgi:hypothetical protein